MMPRVRRIIASKPASNSFTSGSRWRGCSTLMLTPSTMAKKMTESIDPSAAAATTFGGTMSRMRSIGEVETARSGNERVSAPARSAPTPGRITFTSTRPMVHANALVSR